MAHLHDDSNGQIETTRLALREIAQRYGTPTYAFDMATLRSQVEKLRTSLPDRIEVLYSLKANASLGICDVLRQCGIGADVASAGELATALAAGFPPEQIFVAGPWKLAETISQLRRCPAAVISVDSLSELRMLSESGLHNPAVLRLRPDFGSCAVVPAGCESRFGFTEDDVQDCRKFLPDCKLNVIGFHIFAGSQVLNAEKLNGHMRQSMDLALRTADAMGITASLINLGGGFGVPYTSREEELDLSEVGAELAELVKQAPGRFVMELGRYLVAEAGWYVTTVLGHQTHQGRPAVIVDGGVHQRADMCGLCLRSNQDPPLVVYPADSERTPTDILGSLSLPDDVMLEACPAAEIISRRRAGIFPRGRLRPLVIPGIIPWQRATSGSRLRRIWNPADAAT